MSESFVLKIFCLILLATIRHASGTVMPTAIESKENPKFVGAASDVNREARTYGGGDGGYAYNRPYERPAQSRCISCLYAAMVGGAGGGGREAVGGYQDRDRYFENYYYYSRPAYQQREYEDRNWYYQPERYDDRPRYGDRNSAYDNRFDDRYSTNRYQDRYDTRRPTSGYYDRNDYYQNSHNEYRGNGYDNRDPAYYNSIRGSGGAGGGASGGSGGYDAGAYDDRVSNRGYSYSGGSGYGNRPSDRDRYSGNNYDSRYPDDRVYYDRNQGYRGGYEGGRDFRPWDQSYRGVSGFDSSGHGHYYANNNNNPAQSPYYHQQNPQQQQPPLPSTNPHQQSPPRPFQQSSQSPNAPQYNTYQQQQPSYGSQGNAGSGSVGANYNGNKGGSSGYAGGWNYVNGNDRNNQHQSQSNYGQDKDTPQSSPYGEQSPHQGQRTLGTSYLHERDTPNVVTTDNDGAANNNETQSRNNANNESDNGVARDTNDTKNDTNSSSGTNTAANDAKRSDSE